jgi:transposase
LFISHLIHIGRQTKFTPTLQITKPNDPISVVVKRNLRDHADQWWYFLDHPEIPPDNNRSERALRLAVTKRKVSGGSRSMTGFGQMATLLTVVQTCRAQGRSALQVLTQAITQDLPVAALIPTPYT